MIIIEDMEEVEVILGKGGFRGRTNKSFRRNGSRNRNREDRRAWRQSRSRERGIRARSKSSSRSNSRTSTNGDRFRCFKCREYDCFVNECPNLVRMNLIEKVMVKDQHHCRFWQIVIQVQMWNNI